MALKKDIDFLMKSKRLLFKIEVRRKMKKEKLTFTLRLDENLRDYLRARAEKSHRSMNGEILEILEIFKKMNQNPITNSDIWESSNLSHISNH